ncbi:MAG: hypothetical protein HAW63_05155 [Bdellovibrionaceae bacterium]|nr:hypothetical protein [Pseudobdellovibrionaceae bacterium]
MNISCPKCRFSQPKDQYCAQCGIDMSRYAVKSSTKLKKFFINAGIPLGLVVLGAILTYTKKNQCPPLCKNNPTTLTASPAHTVLLKTPVKITRKKILKAAPPIKRRVSSVKAKNITPVATTEKITPSLKKTSASLNKNSFKVEAHLVRFSKSLTDLVQETSSLQFISINDVHLKSVFLENTEILNVFNEKNIKEAINALPSLGPLSKGLKLIVLNGHIKQPEANLKLFLEAINLNLENLENSQDSQSFIAILLNIH